MFPSTLAARWTLVVVIGLLVFPGGFCGAKDAAAPRQKTDTVVYPVDEPYLAVGEPDLQVYSPEIMRGEAEEAERFLRWVCDALAETVGRRPPSIRLFHFPNESEHLTAAELPQGTIHRSYGDLLTLAGTLRDGPVEVPVYVRDLVRLFLEPTHVRFGDKAIERRLAVRIMEKANRQYAYRIDAPKTDPALDRKLGGPIDLYDLIPPEPTPPEDDPFSQVGNDDPFGGDPFGEPADPFGAPAAPPAGSADPFANPSGAPAAPAPGGAPSGAAPGVAPDPFAKPGGAAPSVAPDPFPAPGGAPAASNDAPAADPFGPPARVPAGADPFGADRPPAPQRDPFEPPSGVPAGADPFGAGRPPTPEENPFESVTDWAEVEEHPDPQPVADALPPLRKFKEDLTEQNEVFWRYRTSGNVLPKDIPAEKTDLICNQILWTCQRRCKGDFWGEFFLAAKKRAGPLAAAAAQNTNEGRNRQRQITVECLDEVMRRHGQDFKRLLRDAGISPTSDL